MILAVFTWIGFGIAILLLGLLVIPIGISVIGSINDREGLDYLLSIKWAFGVLTLRAITARPIEIYLLGIYLGRIPLKIKKDPSDIKAEKKKASSWDWLQWTRGNFTNINYILSRFARAGKLQGHIFGEIGLVEPADTAMIDHLTRLVWIDGRRFSLNIMTVYEYETINIKAQIRSTLVIGYLGLVALGLILDKRIREMLRGVPKPVKRRSDNEAS